MKPCATYRKPLALMAVGALDDAETSELRAHLVACAGCREYLAQMEQVTARVRAAEPSVEPESPLYLHHRVRHRLHERTPPQVLQWRLVFSAAAVVIVLLLTMRAGHQQPAVLPVGAPVQNSAVEVSDVSILNYQILASQSLDKLDSTLSEQGSRSLSSSTVYRAGSFAAAANKDLPGI